MLPAPADGAVAARLDATGGLEPASAEDRATRAWATTDAPPAEALDGPAPAWRTGLLVLQGVAVLVVLVLTLPTVRRSRR
ncbi:hypothetical protein [Nocardioides sp. TF02-7]|uniref:hypothetical protein n=1 Tax=Nocardioides sp. TF02-7 TaxID=2917724 RepID=UPI001F05F623|nr:hypothetical protein [Nocardioides sp. TF02-7]UMG93184.1 hypothetical protein MF408_02450 [Nocardioides sp. TF02-7]